MSPPLPSKGLLDGTAIAHMHASVEEADESAWTDTLLPFVAMLMSEEADPALLSIANAFLQRVIEAVCAQLRSSEPVCESMVAALECVLGAKAYYRLALAPPLTAADVMHRVGRAGSTTRATVAPW